MKAVFLMIVAACILGCASTNKKSAANTRPDPQWEWLFTVTCPGTRPEDPQFCKGESWTQIPNQPFEAQIRRARGEQW